LSTRTSRTETARTIVPLWLRVAVLTGLLCVGAAFGVRDAYLDSVEQQQREQFSATADFVARTIQSSLDTIESQTASIVGLVLASDRVSQEELTRFVGMNDQTLGVAGWGIVEFDPIDGTMPVSLYQAAEWSDGVDWSGRDLADERGTRDVVRSALATGEPAMSRFLRLESGDMGTALVVPAPHASGRNIAAVAAIDIEEFEALATESIRDVATVTLSESTETPAAGAFVPERGVGLAGKRWSVVIRPIDDLTGPSPVASSVAALAVAAIVGSLAGALVRRRDLQSSLERTRALNEARDEFLGVISHEIRTPLTAVVGFAGELRTSWDSLDPGERDDMLRLIDEQGREVASIVSDLLVVGRADIHSLHIAMGPVSLPEVVRLAIDSVPWRDRTGLVEGTWAGTVFADRGRLTQVIRNLLVNAVRYGGPRVTIETVEHGGMVDIVVSDDGAGVPDEFATAVFDRYFALPRESAALPSMGLGLYVSRRLAEVMGGSLTYERVDGWSRFVASIPAAEPVDAGGEGVGLPAGQNAGSHTV
jgi:signal transduction histidine kinase